MPHHDRLRDIENPLRYEGPALADSEAGGNMGPARCVSRSYHAWLWLVVGLVAMGVPSPLYMLAAGLVAAGVAGQLFDPERRGRGRSGSGNRYAP